MSEEQEVETVGWEKQLKRRDMFSLVWKLEVALMVIERYGIVCN